MNLLIMSLSVLFLTAFTLGFSGALAPGPLLTVTINQSMLRGLAAGPLLVVGHAILEAGILAALVLGLGILLQGPVVSAVVGLVGSSILTWMGISMIQGSARVQVERPVATQADGFKSDFEEASHNLPKSKTSLNLVFTGAITSVSNPYWLLWWATIGATYIMFARAHGPLGILAFYFGHILADLSWYSAVSAAVASGKRLLAGRPYKIVMQACGSFLIALAIYFVYFGITTLMVKFEHLICLPLLGKSR